METGLLEVSDLMASSKYEHQSIEKTELKLTNVARASLEELRLDYEDFLRQRGLPLWAKEDPRRRELVGRRCTTTGQVADWVKEIHHGHDGRNGQDGQNEQRRRGRQDGPDSGERSRPDRTSIESIGSIPSTYPEIAANAAHVLVGVACALLDRQIATQARAFEEEGGFTERLYRVRSERRRKGP